MTKQECIRNTMLFQGLEEQQVDALARISIEKKHGRGEMIFFDGDEANGFYVVLEGKVKIFKTSFQGKEQILHIFDEGQPFGEVPVFHGTPFPASAQSLVKSSTLFFPRKEFIALLTENPAITFNMLAVLSMRLRKFTQQIENLSLKEVPARLASYLLVLSEEQDGEDTVELEISKGQLASLLGTIPETLSRIFARMSDQGLIEVSGKKITLLDKQGLADLD